MQSTLFKQINAAMVIQKFYHKYIEKSNAEAFESYLNERTYGKYWGDEHGYGCSDEWDCDKYWGHGDQDDDDDNGMYSLRNGDYTDDWESYIDDVYN